jgi:hypothetical protein
MLTMQTILIGTGIVSGLMIGLWMYQRIRLDATIVDGCNC